MDIGHEQTARPIDRRHHPTICSKCPCWSMAGKIVQAGQALRAHALLNCTITASESRGRGAFSSSNLRPLPPVSCLCPGCKRWAILVYCRGERVVYGPYGNNPPGENIYSPYSKGCSTYLVDPESYLLRSPD
jgi:hypothetical protein